MNRAEIEQVMQRFAGNSRVVFREGPYEDYPEVTEVTTYVDGELLPIASMADTGDAVGADETAAIAADIENSLALDRAAMEAELRDLIGSVALRDLRTLLRMAKDFEPRHLLNARYSVDAEGSHADEAWPLERILESNPDSFEDKDIEALRRLPVGGKLSFGGGAWAEFTITRVS